MTGDMTDLEMKKSFVRQNWRSASSDDSSGDEELRLTTVTNHNEDDDGSSLEEKGRGSQEILDSDLG